jgi:hypothetical protein
VNWNFIWSASWRKCEWDPACCERFCQRKTRPVCQADVEQCSIHAPLGDQFSGDSGRSGGADNIVTALSKNLANQPGYTGNIFGDQDIGAVKLPPLSIAGPGFIPHSIQRVAATEDGAFQPGLIPLWRHLHRHSRFPHIISTTPLLRPTVIVGYSRPPGLIRPVPRRLCETARTGNHLSNLFEKLVGREWFRENSLIQRTTSRLPIVADQQDGSPGEQLSRCNSQLQSIHAAGKV